MLPIALHMFLYDYLFICHIATGLCMRTGSAKIVLNSQRLLNITITDEAITSKFVGSFLIKHVRHRHISTDSYYVLNMQLYVGS